MKNDATPDRAAIRLEEPIDYSKARPMPRLKHPMCRKCGFCVTCDGCQCQEPSDD